ncbi:tetratricopeptide repeat protein 9C-like [Denticeps clupeoides]|uniref:Tetratricopeptide repeat protein 9C n=1 Tax=Denticeps clupeoides TaxID=299321 RepID=A0A8C4AZ23_9TELE|nr:tetratricopeptide repeat protein 9C-like [Denticeps clupeoides]XP_028822330.1 tetratricopeptide repeat protein 9C-like [Denticeps clupeoides]
METKVLDVGTEQLSACCSTSRLDAQLQDSVRLKTEGNAFYRDKKWRAAIGRYHHALLILRGLDSNVTSAIQAFGQQAPVLNSEQQELLRNTQVDCYNNLAACLLQRESIDYARVQEYSLRVLQWRPTDTKALYRAGVSTLELGDAQAARQYLLQASKSQPNDANVRRQLQRVEEKLSKDYQKEKALYKGMFTKEKQGGDMPEETVQKRV